MRNQWTDVTVIDRFWARVGKRGPDDCWEWQGPLHHSRYGSIWVGKRQYRAHRMSAFIHFGMFDQRLHVLHRCDNPPCVNPSHLYLGTIGDNVRDSVERRRHASTVKETCPQGHPYSHSIVSRGSTERRCRQCSTEASRRYRARKSGRAEPSLASM